MREFDAIEALSARLPAPPEGVLEPIGDDCAVVRLGGEVWLAAADMLVSGRHFEGWAAPQDVGYKVVAANVSDVAAMGGTPRFVLVSGGAPEAETVLRCMEGVLEACAEFGAYPLGGDTTGADALVVDVAILGSLDGGRPVLRSGARAGDLLAVTGELGASAAGLLALQAGEREPARLVRRHLRPEPRVGAGRAAARHGAGAMIDLSDGLASDAAHVARASGVHIEIDLDALPLAEGVADVARQLGVAPYELAAGAGEDYELCACVAVGDRAAAEAAAGLTWVGSVAAGRAQLVMLSAGIPQSTTGFHHRL